MMRLSLRQVACFTPFQAIFYFMRVAMNHLQTAEILPANSAEKQHWNLSSLASEPIWGFLSFIGFRSESRLVCNLWFVIRKYRFYNRPVCQSINKSKDRTPYKLLLHWHEDIPSHFPLGDILNPSRHLHVGVFGIKGSTTQTELFVHWK